MTWRVVIKVTAPLLDEDETVETNLIETLFDFDLSGTHASDVMTAAGVAFARFVANVCPPRRSTFDDLPRVIFQIAQLITRGVPMEPPPPPPRKQDPN